MHLCKSILKLLIFVNIKQENKVHSEIILVHTIYSLKALEMPVFVTALVHLVHIFAYLQNYIRAF